MRYTAQELSSKDAITLENMLREVVSDLAAIRKRNGDTLTNVSKADAEQLRELNANAQTIGEALDAKREEDGAEPLFRHFDRVLNEVAEDGKHPGHGRGGGAGTSGRELHRGGSLYQAAVQAGFGKPGISRITVGPGPLYAAVTVAAPDTLAPARRVGTIALGQDQRYVYPALRSEPLSSLDTAVDYLQETARTLADPDTMRRALTAVTAKPESAVTVALQHATLFQLAHIVSDVPNVVFRQPAIRNVLDRDMRLGLAEAIDAMVAAEIAATTIPSGGAVGGSLATRIRKAIKVVQDAGYEPDTLAINSQGSLDLDLEFLALDNSTGVSPSWGLQVRVGKRITGSGLVFDSRAFGAVHLSPVELATFEQDAGQTNKSRIRGELHGRATIEVPSAAATVPAAA